MPFRPIAGATFLVATIARVLGTANCSPTSANRSAWRSSGVGWFCRKLFEEKRSGTIDARPQLKECLNYVRDDDHLIVTRIDRLARLTLHLCQIAETLREKGVDLVVLDQNIDTSDATGRLLFNMLGAIGQFETEIRAERQMDGIKKAKDRGVQFGKRPALTDNQIAELRFQKQAPAAKTRISGNSKWGIQN